MNTMQSNRFFLIDFIWHIIICTYILFTRVGWQVTKVLVQSFSFFDKVKIWKGKFSWFVSTVLMNTYKGIINLRKITWNKEQMKEDETLHESHSLRFFAPHSRVFYSVKLGKLLDLVFCKVAKIGNQLKISCWTNFFGGRN